MMQSIKKLQSIKIFFSAVLTLLAVSCSTETEPQIPDPDEGRETSVVDISLSLGETWDIDDGGTRAVPPSIKDNDVDNSESYYEDIKDVNDVRVIAFRRKEGDKGEFFYDMKNDMILPVTQTEQGDHKHSIAKGKITKTYGYEYRVIAIAYSSTKESTFSTAFTKAPDGEGNWFKTVGETYSNFCMELNTIDCSDWADYLKIAGVNSNVNNINEEILETPNIFYGVLYSENSNLEIIPYAEELKKDILEDVKEDVKDEDKKVLKKGDMYSKVKLKGILKRGVASIEFDITPVGQGITASGTIQWITILAQTPNTKVGLSKYDDFLKPSGPYDDSKKYTAIAYIKVTNGKCDPVTVRMLPCKTRLAIRVRSHFGADYLRNGQLTGDGIVVPGNNGTGIVSPDLINDIFYFRRNHKYTIKVSNTEEIVKAGSKTDFD